MESSPQPEPEHKNTLENLGKVAMVSAVLLAGVTTEAQVNHIEKEETPVSQEKHSSIEKVSRKILQTVSEIEESMKSLSEKVSKKDEMVYAVITQSAGLRQANLLPNNLEFALTEDIEDILVNKKDRTYKVSARGPGAINTILKEKHLMEEMGNTKASEKILKIYSPVDVYFTLGIENISGSVKQVIIRRIDIRTKEVKLYTIDYKLQRRDVDEGYHNLSLLVEKKMKEIINQEDFNK